MEIDFRPKWQRAKAARPSGKPPTRNPPVVRMTMDGLGILYLSFDPRDGGDPTYVRYAPRKQTWPDALLEDYLRPGRWRKPTKAELAKLARRVRHPMGRPAAMELTPWSAGRYGQ